MRNLLIIILILIVIYFILQKEESYQVNMSEIKTDETILNIIRDMLKDVHNLFQKNNITYWIDAGTLLGAVRHKNVIPWDDDVDICVLKKDEQKLLNLKSKMNNMGYDITKFWGGYKIFSINGRDIQHQNRNWKWSQKSQDIRKDEVFNYKYPFIDVFLVQNDNNGNKYQYSDVKVRRVWPKFYYKTENLFPLKKYLFHDFYLFGPKNAIPYLDRAYSPDWPYKAYKQYDHENQILFKKRKFSL